MDTQQDFINEGITDILQPSIAGFNNYLMKFTTFEERMTKTHAELWSDYLDGLEIARKAQKDLNI